MLETDVENTLRDPRGTVLEIGQKVAYNMSGTIAVGTIKMISYPKLIVGKTYDYHGQTYKNPDRMGPPTITIEHKTTTAWTTRPVSKVKSENNLLVLFED